MGTAVTPEGQTQNAKPFMGLPYQDKNTLSDAKRLIQISSIGLAYYIVQIIITAASYGSSVFAVQDFVSIGIAIALPFCAYFGARDQNQPLIGCLACCSGLGLGANAFVFYIALAFGLALISALTAVTVILDLIILCYAIKLCMALKGDVTIIVQQTPGQAVVLQTNTIPVAQTVPGNAQPL